MFTIDLKKTRNSRIEKSTKNNEIIFRMSVHTRIAHVFEQIPLSYNTTLRTSRPLMGQFHRRWAGRRSLCPFTLVPYPTREGLTFPQHVSFHNFKVVAIFLLPLLGWTEMGGDFSSAVSLSTTFFLRDSSTRFSPLSLKKPLQFRKIN